MYQLQETRKRSNIRIPRKYEQLETNTTCMQLKPTTIEKICYREIDRIQQAHKRKHTRESTQEVRWFGRAYSTGRQPTDKLHY